MAKKGGIGPEGTALSGDWGGESHEIQDQGGYSIGNDRDFLNGPGSKNKQSETTFSGKDSGIVKAGMDSGVYKAAPFTKISGGAVSGAMGVLNAAQEDNQKLVDEGLDEIQGAVDAPVEAALAGAEKVEGSSGSGEGGGGEGEGEGGDSDDMAKKAQTAMSVMALMSDSRLKKDIKLIGLSPSGLKIYNFKYKDTKYGKGTYQGVMSNEVPQSAVIKNANGYDMVNYNKLDVDFKEV